MNYKMNQLGQTAIVICSIALSVLLFYLAYCMCKRYATDPDSEEIQDYIGNSSANIFKERVFSLHPNAIYTVYALDKTRIYIFYIY